MGLNVSTGGDINGDGYADVIVDAYLYDNGHTDEGAAFVFLGNSAGRPVLAQQNDGTPGSGAIQPWGISRGDGGFGVSLQAISPRGRELARLQLEACPSGVPLGSFLCTDGLGASWTDTTASAGGVELQAVVSGLEPGLYRWRARPVHAPVGQPGRHHAAGESRSRAVAQAEEADIRVPAAIADLAVTVDDGQATAVPGEPVSYTIVAANVAGPTTVVGATVSDVFPAELPDVSWTCEGSGGGACAASGTGDIDESVDLPPGGSVTFIATGTIDPGATGSLINSALVHPSGRGSEGRASDPDPSNNSAIDIDDLTPEADLAITVDDGTDMAVVGMALTYTITTSNPGPSDAPGALVVDAFPSALLNVAWTCRPAPQSSSRQPARSTRPRPARRWRTPLRWPARQRSPNATSWTTVTPTSTPCGRSSSPTASSPATPRRGEPSVAARCDQ